MSATEEKEPQTFTHFFTSAIESVKAAIESRRGKANETQGRRIAKLQAVVIRGHRAREFMTGEFWKQDLMPHFEENSSRAMKPWRPGQPMDAVDANYFYSSGYANAFYDMLSKLRSWSDEGMTADRELQFELARQKQDEQRRTR